jgi:hypothetical protein
VSRVGAGTNCPATPKALSYQCFMQFFDYYFLFMILWSLAWRNIFHGTQGFFRFFMQIPLAPRMTTFLTCTFQIAVAGVPPVLSFQLDFCARPEISVNSHLPQHKYQYGDKYSEFCMLNKNEKIHC